MSALPVTSLHDRFVELELIADTLEALENSDLPSEVRTDLEDQLVASLAGTREKVDRTSAVLASFEAGELAADREIKRLQERKARMVKQRERLEGYVLFVLSVANIKKFEGHTSTLAVRVNPPKVVVDTEEWLEIDMLRFPPTPEPEPDKKLIGDLLKAGKEVPGCRLVRTTKLVRS